MELTTAERAAVRHALERYQDEVWGAYLIAKGGESAVLTAELRQVESVLERVCPDWMERDDIDGRLPLADQIIGRRE